MSVSADIEIERSEDIIGHVAETVLGNHQELLPDLQNVKVIFPNSNVCNAFRKNLLAKLPATTPGIIPPWAGTLKDYLRDHLATQQDAHIISQETRRLLFIETLDAYPSLFKDENKWQVTAFLLNLFDELYLANQDILNTSEEQWFTFLQSAYHIKDDYQSLRNEATLIQTLWLAWQNQLDANQMIDPVRAYVENLSSYSTSTEKNILYIVTTDSYTTVEKAFFEKIKQTMQCFVIEYKAETMEQNTYLKFIDYAYDIGTPLRQRAEQHSDELKDVNLPYAFFPADSDEAEACAVELQIRKWLLDGKSNLGIVCENRKLSRRIRALLERADVPLQDLSGWSLSTTSAATVLESWLRCIEEDFDNRVLLDLLKSHFFMPMADIEFHKQSVYRLEHDIILNENISSNLSRYKKQLKIRASKLQHWPENTYTHIENLLSQIESVSLSLITLYISKVKRPLKSFLDALLYSLDEFSISHAFNNDDAGKIIMNCLHEMENGLNHSNPDMLWSDFRIWLSINMESTLFKPQTSSSPVALLSIQQTDLMRFDALVIAAADKQHYPGTAENSPFFNQGVRKTLHLPDWKLRHEQRLKQFKNLLFSSSEILITYKNKDKGEAIPLSPWVSALQQSYRAICNKPIIDQQLINELTTENARISNETDLITEPSSQPSIAIPPDLMPLKISASAHQTLINCPYLYFAAYALSLKPSEEISDELQKSDYGRLIHRTLQAFHLPSKEKVEAFKHEITVFNRQDAIDHLIDISEQLFHRDLENNALHKSWLYRWTKQIPGYIDWQIKHQKNWHVTSTEQQLSCDLTNNKTLYGRVDRIDTSLNHKLIIDYKTGKSAKQDVVDAAEDVQLLTYALLDDDVDNVFYLDLDNNNSVRKGASISDDSLVFLKESAKKRLNDIIKMTHDGQTYTAWGNEKTCSYCKYTGICRKPFWEVE